MAKGPLKFLGQIEIGPLLRVSEATIKVMVGFTVIWEHNQSDDYFLDALGCCPLSIMVCIMWILVRNYEKVSSLHQ